MSQIHPLMTRNPTNSHIVDSGKGRNDLIAIPDKFGVEHIRVQRFQYCLAKNNLRDNTKTGLREKLNTAGLKSHHSVKRHQHMIQREEKRNPDFFQAM
ncbi:hypothetical protein J6590_080266 [Homalodisca vitripennis]|nr:hypothetical protein J6590_080266 [Homalodisca vitripennis]